MQIKDDMKPLLNNDNVFASEAKKKEFITYIMSKLEKGRRRCRREDEIINLTLKEKVTHNMDLLIIFPCYPIRKFLKIKYWKGGEDSNSFQYKQFFWFHSYY